MKKIFIYILIIGLVGSCNFSEMNIDPNRLTGEVITSKYRLPTFEYLYFTTMANNIVKRVGNISGYVIYINGPVGLNNYAYTPADGSNLTLWENLYISMNSGYQLIETAAKENAPHHAAIGKILMAAAIGQTTVIYGDVPYSQAFRAAQYQFPIFDNQSDVYKSIQQLLDDAIADLSKTQVPAVAAEDLIYKGDVAKWKKVAYALKARYYLHTIKVNTDAYNLASTALASALQSNTDNCFISFQSGQTGEINPLYLERTGTLETEVDPVFADLLVTLNDPRKDFYAGIKKSLLTGTRAKYGPYYAMSNSIFPLINYDECLFMQAEIAMKNADKPSAKTYLNNAILASLQRVCKADAGSSDPAENNLVKALPDSVLTAYATKQSNISLLTDDIAWKRIFQQKYIAMFLQAEAWNDYRRTENLVQGTPGLPEIKIRTGSQLPRRFQYSAREVSQRLQNIPPDYTIYDRFWWDAKP
ncbi:MAG: SusD/RagB family nutrient-binding outer membrane lipoprotein [Cytophagales bacterium]|nr:SusD/RagB family nutrient-binding outer membrane lipoprotein [Cytophagales bacterium]